MQINVITIHRDASINSSQHSMHLWYVHCQFPLFDWLAAVQSAYTPNFSYSGANFEVFRSTGDALHRRGWSTLPHHISLYRCRGGGCGPQNWKFYQNFRISMRAYVLSNFHQIITICGSFMFGHVLKFGWIHSRGFSVVCEHILEVLERYAPTLSPCQVWWDQTLHAARGGEFQFFYPSRFWMTKMWMPFCHQSFGIRKHLGIVELGNVCSCAPTFNFVCTTVGGATAEWRSWKYGKIWDFSPLKDDMQWFLGLLKYIAHRMSLISANLFEY